jgi:hypothetical protein
MDPAAVETQSQFPTGERNGFVTGEIIVAR